MILLFGNEESIFMRGYCQKYGEYLFLLLIFVSIVIFFYKIHPFILFDADDWKDMSELRNVAFPKWHDWNPIKVLPETLMALTGYIGAYAIFPIIGDYLKGISMAIAIVVALFVTIYISLVKDVLVNKFNIQETIAFSIAFLFLLFHFLIFKDGAAGNIYLFSTIDVDCLFHYVIPFLVNASMILYFISKDIKGNYLFTENRTKSSIFIFTIFLSIYSNILLSIIFISYIVGMILHDIAHMKVISFAAIKQYIKENKLYTGIMLAWLISLFFEANGGRAHDIETASMLTSLVKTILSFVWIFLQGQKGLNIMYAIFAIMVIPAIWYRNRKKVSHDTAADKNYSFLMKLNSFCLLFWLLFQIPVCAKANATYIARTDVLAGFFFFIFMMIAISMAYLLKRVPNLLLIFPIIFFMIFCRTLNGNKGYFASTYHHIPEQTCYAITNDLISQFQEADKAGLQEFDLHVPKYSTEDNWPQPDYLAHRMEKQLYSHSLIANHLKANVVIDEAMNDKYHIEDQK